MRAASDDRLPGLAVTHRSEVTDDQIDHLGHMNVRFYGENAHAATLALAAALGVGERVLRLADTYTRHHREQLLGAALEVRSGVLEADASGLRLYHELRNPERDELAATFVHRVETGPEPLASSVIDAARTEQAAIPDHGRSRSIDLEGDPAATAPTIDELERRGLAMRRPREITPEECDEHGDYIPSMAPMLTWGGEPIGEHMGPVLIDGPNGERMGWASMETRMTAPRLPRLGDRIQAFGATVMLADKVSHRVQWAFDLARGDLLCCFQVVNLAFDTIGRRAMSIPAEARERFAADLHVDLAPTADI